MIETDPNGRHVLSRPSSTSLKCLASTANEHHRQAEHLASKVLDHAREAGQALIAAKRSLLHGNFESWVQENCEFSGRTARSYMRIANNWPEIGRARTDNPDLSIREAVGMLSEQKSATHENGSALPKCSPIPGTDDGSKMGLTRSGEILSHQGKIIVGAQIPDVSERSPDDDDSDQLFTLKHAWKTAKKKDRQRFIEWTIPARTIGGAPSKAIELAHDAVNALKRMPFDDPRRHEAFQFVLNYVKVSCPPSPRDAATNGGGE